MNDLSHLPGNTYAPPAAKAPRFDLYAVIHKALRHFMSDTLHRVGALDVSDDAETEATLGQLHALLGQLRSHIKHENDFVHTAIEARQPAGARRIADEHLEHLDGMRAIEDDMRALRQAPAATRPQLALRLYRHLAVFVGENLAHMQVEETQHNATLWAHYTDAELLGLHDRLVASIEPREMLDTVHWIAPALTPQELAHMLGDMRDKAPPGAFEHVLGIVRGRLDAGRWKKLTSALAL